MNKNQTRIIDLSVELELLMADLYLLFYGAHPEDADFWWQLALEEKNHAALLKSVEETYKLVGDFPTALLAGDFDELKAAAEKLKLILAECEKRAPNRSQAFAIAYEMEQHAGELHFQKFMADGGSDNVTKIYRQLNSFDVDHVKRIRAYVNLHGIDS